MIKFFVFLILGAIFELTYSQNLYNIHIEGVQNRIGYLTRYNHSICQLDTISTYNLQAYDYASDEYRGIAYSSSALFFPMKRKSDNKIGLLKAYFYQPNQFDFIPLNLPANLSTYLNDLIYDPLENSILSFGVETNSNTIAFVKIDSMGNTNILIAGIPLDYFLMSNYIQTQMSLNAITRLLYFSSSHNDSVRLLRYNMQSNILDSIMVWKFTDSVAMGSGMFYSYNRNSLITLGVSGDTIGLVEYDLNTLSTKMIFRKLNNRVNDAMAYDFLNDIYFLRTKDTLWAINVSNGSIIKQCIHSKADDFIEAIVLPLNLTIDIEKINQWNSYRVRVFPNPGNEYFEVKLPQNEFPIEIVIYDLKGRLIKKEIIIDKKDSIQIDTKHLQSGLYLLNIKTLIGNYNQLWNKQ